MFDMNSTPHMRDDSILATERNPACATRKSIKSSISALKNRRRNNQLQFDIDRFFPLSTEIRKPDERPPVLLFGVFTALIDRTLSKID